MGLIALTLLIVLAVWCDSGRQNPSEQAFVAKRISESASLTALDKFCVELPKPTEFKLIGKSLGGNNFTYDIGYQMSGDISFDSVKEFYFKWAEETGWTFNPDHSYLEQLYFSFSKDDYLLTVSKSGAYEYMLNCDRFH